MKHSLLLACCFLAGLVPVVISEIMYHPDWPDSGPNVSGRHEYIELHHRDAEAVPLSHADTQLRWTFTAGIEFSFPAAPQSAVIGAGVEFGQPVRLNKSETLDIEILDRVTYGDGTSNQGHDGWPPEADGQGASLHRVLTAPYGNSADSCFAGPPTPGF